MRAVIIAGVLALAGCATTQAPAPKPAVQVVYQRVEVPIAITCMDKTKIPAEPPKVAGKLTGDARHDLDVVSGSAVRLRAYGAQLLAIISGCAD